RTYPVGDLIHNDEDLESIMTAIREIVPDDEEHGAWGAQNKIAKVPNLGSLIIRQTEKGHNEVLELLRLLRETKAEGARGDGRLGGGGGSGGGFF
ncbi:MAG: hypothetical protein JWN70_5413, partial [Planctomycetaceae bacterium]|nr:hypothetical protein [Planctomycetaceae bacterium]